MPRSSVQDRALHLIAEFLNNDMNVRKEPMKVMELTVYDYSIILPLDGTVQ